MSFVSADYLLSETDETECLSIYGRSDEISRYSNRYQTTNVTWFKSFESNITYRMKSLSVNKKQKEKYAKYCRKVSIHAICLSVNLNVSEWNIMTLDTMLKTKITEEVDKSGETCFINLEDENIKYEIKSSRITMFTDH